jgi:Transposase, Mutator family
VHLQVQRIGSIGRIRHDEVLVHDFSFALHRIRDEADRLCNAQRYERSEARRDTRAGHCERKLQTKAGEVKLRIPKLRAQTFETAIIERYLRRESSVEEALIEMYLAGVSARRVEDITEALCDTRVSPSTVSDLNKKIYGTIEAWRNRPIEGDHPYVYLDGIVLKRSWAGEVRNVSLLVAIGVNSDGYREILGICEGAKEDKAGWSGFLKHLKERGLKGVRLIISDACMGLAESAAEFFPDAAWQRCVVPSLRLGGNHQDRMHLVLEPRAMPYDLITSRHQPSFAFGPRVRRPDLRQVAGRLQTGERAGIDLVRLYVSLCDRLHLQRIGDNHPRHERRQHSRHPHAVGGRLDHNLITGQQALAKSLQRGPRHIYAARTSEPAVFPKHHFPESSVDIDANHASHAHLLPDT